MLSRRYKTWQFGPVLRLLLASPFIVGSQLAQGWDQYRCPAGVVTSTVYNLPTQSDPRSYSDFKSFNDSVGINGSGVTADGKILHYFQMTKSGRHYYPKKNAKPMVNQCADSMGSPTTIGARGRCLTPFFSIAADLSIYPVGTIIEVPSMKGKKVSLPPDFTRTVTHPGYFVVDDTGAAIKGSNRFDFFTGTTSPKDTRNDFGNRQASTKNGGDRSMLFSDTHACNKGFKVISRRNAGYDSALAEVNSVISGENSTNPPILAFTPRARKSIR